MATTSKHHVVVVGGGFAGLKAARTLSRRKDVQVTLVDRVNHHLFQPLLYQVATGILSPGQVAPALRSLFRDQENVRVLLGEVTGFDLDVRTVQLHAAGETQTLAYDSLLVAAGATHSYFGHDEWVADAPGMKTLADAEHLRGKLLASFEAAELTDDPDERRAALTFAIVGAGPTGVELAGQVAFLARRMLEGEYRRFDSRDARIVLLDAAPHLLGGFPERLQGKARKQLEGMGVEVQLQAQATGIDAYGIDLATPDGPQRLQTRTVVWAAGVQASPLATLLAEAAGAQQDRAGRLHVEPDLSLPGHPEVFAAGDMVALEGVPGVAQGAIQGGSHIAKVIAKRLDGKDAPGAFSYFDKGAMAVVGRSQAIARVGRVQVAGRLAWLMWAVVHVAFLVGWHNRLETVRRWFIDLVTNSRHERLVTVAELPELGAGSGHASAAGERQRTVA